MHSKPDLLEVACDAEKITEFIMIGDQRPGLQLKNAELR
jgi:hypothetical protein